MSPFCHNSCINCYEFSVQFAGYMHLAFMNKFLIPSLSLLILACQSGSDPSRPEASEAAPNSLPPASMMARMAPEQDVEPKPDEAAPEQPVQPATPTTRKIIRNAQLRLRVSDFAASGRAIEQAVKQVNGEIANSNETKSDNAIENALMVRVPVAQLDAFLNLVLKESIFTDTKTITADDVTRRYVDVEARIRSKKVVEETYLRLLKQARDVGDVLKVEQQLGQIREEREVQEAELRQLKNEVAFSTVNLTYYQQVEAALRPEEPLYVKIGHNLRDGFRLVSDVFVGVFYLLPLGLLVAGVIWLLSRWRRSRAKSV